MNDVEPPEFNELAYLDANPDVEAAVRAGDLESGFQHWCIFGKSEGRPGLGSRLRPNLSTEDCEAKAVDVPGRTVHHCVYCDRDIQAWTPFHITEKDVSPFLRKVGITGSNVSRLWCPHCSSTDRERHLKLYFDRLSIWPEFDGAAVLHMAPEPNLGANIRSRNPRRYVMGDLHPAKPDIMKVDLAAIPVESGSFDVVICNHVLEHVERPKVALAEVARVLRRGGRFVCQTPFASRLSQTFEDPQLQSPDDRLFFYGQDDHLRLFGGDIERLICDAGFIGRLRQHDEMLSDVDPERVGVNELEPFFDFVRA
jgi:methyltransferase family protein